MNRDMDGWTEGWMDRVMDGWMDEGCIDERVEDGWVEG